MFCVYTVQNKLIVGLAGTTLAILLIWSFIKMRKSKNVDRKTKQTTWWLLLVLVSVITVMIVKLMGLTDIQKQAKPIIKPVKDSTATRDQLERRSQSENYCKAHQVPIYAYTLFVDPEAEVSIRAVDEVVDRALALCYIGLKSEGLEQRDNWTK